MIECIFTIDYEIYGNGTGSLKELIYEPARRLGKLFRKWNVRFVIFVEAAELRSIEAAGTDRDIALIERQISELHREGFEIALHLHPQWSNSRHEGGQWRLDFTEYNLCTLPQRRVEEIVDQSLGYLRHAVGESGFNPISFRAGNWLFQPAKTAAAVLGQRGIRIDSSVFKGGLQHIHGLDYRRAPRNGYYWRFEEDAIEPDTRGSWMEVPIYTEMVPTWRVFTGKRVVQGNGFSGALQTRWQKFNRLRDFVRLSYPLKLDLCRMKLSELTSMMGRIMREDSATPDKYRPIVSIGHTKDPIDYDTIDEFLSFLRAAGISIVTFLDAYPKLLNNA